MSYNAAKIYIRPFGTGYLWMNCSLYIYITHTWWLWWCIYIWLYYEPFGYLHIDCDVFCVYMQIQPAGKVLILCQIRGSMIQFSKNVYNSCVCLRTTRSGFLLSFSTIIYFSADYKWKIYFSLKEISKHDRFYHKIYSCKQYCNGTKFSSSSHFCEKR